MTTPTTTTSPYRFFLNYVPKEETYLVTSEGGGGHKSAADAIQLNLLKQAGNKPVVHRVDVLRNSILPNFIADMAIGAWDKAKKEGNVEKQIHLMTGKFLGLISYRALSEFIFFIPIFLKTFFTLMLNRRITRIIDTQVMGTSAMLAAARLVNFIFSRYIQVYKVMTDMPTADAIHFSDSAKNLSKADKEIYHILSTNPFPKYQNETDEHYEDRQDAWWKEHFSLSLKEGGVQYADFPLRPAFMRAKEGIVSSEIGVKLNSDEEKELLVKAGIIQDTSPCEKEGKALDSKTGTVIDISYPYVPIAVEENDMVGLVTIGSMANAGATKAYIDDVLELVDLYNEITPEGNEHKKFHLFVACGRHEPNTSSLFSEVAEMIRKKKEEHRFPPNLNIVPMGFQSDEEMAPLMHRADFAVYGAGGLTTMETLNASDAQRSHVFIHSDAKASINGKTNDEIENELLEGFALWERGNAEFQLRNNVYEAHLVSPKEVFGMRLRELLEMPKVTNNIVFDPESLKEEAAV